MIVPAEKKFAVSHDARDALRNTIYALRCMHETGLFAAPKKCLNWFVYLHLQLKALSARCRCNSSERPKTACPLIKPTPKTLEDGASLNPP